ncbi:MAG: hypothetical protein OXD43_09260 [Bacteroidetes bacterium]|nr:hypothetical protein [Bacteroidota bacterium]
MATIFERDDLPDHLFSIPRLDFCGDLLADRVGGPWFRLGAQTIDYQRIRRGVEGVIKRQSMLLEPGSFAEVYDKLNYVIDRLDGLGKPGGYKWSGEGKEEYGYAPFHRFNLRSISCEPLVFSRQPNPTFELSINPDLQLYFSLEEISDGIWWNPKRGVVALKRMVVENDNLQIVEIRTDHLRRYLQVRQQALLVGHYRDLYLDDPSEEAAKVFVEEDTMRGSPDQGAKVLVQNLRSGRDPLTQAYIGRRLHLWFEIQPPEINIDDPWAEEAPFDRYEFTLPTKKGPVAPDLFRVGTRGSERDYDGVTCNRMDRIYFEQEVLSKYEGDSRCEIKDNGSVSCRHYWGLERSTSRIGNELLRTEIGDFAVGLPFAEWPHWKQYAVEPPSSETIKALRKEPEIPSIINNLIQDLEVLGNAMVNLARAMHITNPHPFWCSSGESLAARHLKRVYPATASDDEFLERATLMSTLIIDGLECKTLRQLCQAWGKDLHQDGDGKSLGSRKLLERVTLIALLVDQVQPRMVEIPELVKQAEEQPAGGSISDLQIELRTLNEGMRDDLAPLAFLYDLRIYGGLAHRPHKKKAAKAAVKLGLPAKNWHRNHFLYLLELVANSVRQASDYLLVAADECIGRQLSMHRQNRFPS